ncbi:hypothetical protein ACHAW6_000129 [Cyclotella cf. meneghiniana]
MVDIQGQLFTDQTGRFPVTSNRGNNYIVIFYMVDANHFKSCPIKSRHRTELLLAYNDVYAYLRVQGYHPQLHKLDNNILHQKSIKPTLPNEQSTPGKTILLPCMLCKDLEKTDITLNMMHPCTQNPNLSANKAIVGMFSFDTTPMAPLETECMLHVKPNRRHTWGYHSIKAWYFAPVLNHYCCIKVVTDTGMVRLADTFLFLHHSLPIPTISNADRIIKGDTTSNQNHHEPASYTTR